VSAPLTHAEHFARLDGKLRELRNRARREVLAPPQLGALETVSIELTKMIPQLARYVEALEESRGLALEDARALLARVRQVDLEASMLVVTELHRAGRIRGAVRAYLGLLRRAPHDDQFGERMLGFAALLEQYGVYPAAGMLGTLGRTLAPGWWRAYDSRDPVIETLRYLPIDWSRLPA